MGAPSSYFPWIDNLKGIAIIMIIAHHLGLANQEYYQWFHTGQGVSIFLFCSAFVLSRKQGLYSVGRIKKLVRRIIFPMLFCTMILFAVSCVFMPPITALTNCLHGAGFGPGTYYPWMYILFWLFIPLFQKINSKCSNILNSFICISVICAILELLFHFVISQISNDYVSIIRRIIPVRYLMIIFGALNFHFFEERLVLNIFLISNMRFSCVVWYICNSYCTTFWLARLPLVYHPLRCSTNFSPKKDKFRFLRHSREV